MKSMEITAVGIDVSKRKSTVAIRRPGGVIVACPFDISHSSHDLEKLVSILKTTGGDIRVVMEHTSNYWKPIALTLKNAGFYVSVVNAMLIHDFSDNSIRKLKTDRADSLKIANYALTFWNQLPPFNDEDETRLVLKEQSRMYERLASTATSLRNGLIALADQTFPSIDQAFGHAIKNADGHEKWVDFFSIYWHRDCVLRLSIEKFTESYRKWCLRRNYKFRTNTAHKLYALAQDAVPTLPKNNGTKALVLQACKSLNAVCEAKQSTQEEMNRLASLLPEYEVVMQMEGTGPITGPALMAEIGDVRRFKNKKALVAFAGIDAPPFQSGNFESKSRHVSKRGSPHLRRTVFLVANIILTLSHKDNSVFCFMDKKRAEGKHYYVYTIAGSAKFLRIYYARVSEYLRTQGLVYRLRQKFSIISDEPLVLSSASGYQLNPELHIMTDYQRFDELVSSAVRASSVINKVDILKNALDLYHGKVLSSADGEHWLIQFSTKYHLSYMGAVSELLKQLDSLHSYDLLNQYAMKSLTIAPDNPKAYCWLIRSLKAQGMNELATNELAAAKEHLTTEEYEEILAFGANW